MNKIGLKLLFGPAACMVVVLMLLFALRGNAEATTLGISWTFDPQPDVGPNDEIFVFATVTHDYCSVITCPPNGDEILVDFYQTESMEPVIIASSGTPSPSTASPSSSQGLRASGTHSYRGASGRMRPSPIVSSTGVSGVTAPSCGTASSFA